MVEVHIGGGIDWNVIVGPVSALAGVAVGWWLQNRTESKRRKWRIRTALALVWADIREASFKVDQLVNQSKAAPGRASVQFTFPSFRVDAGEISAALDEAAMGRLTAAVYAAEDMTVIYGRIAAATPAHPPVQTDIDSLNAWLADLHLMEADLSVAAKPYANIKP